MEVKLLRDLLNKAMSNPNEESRVGMFWCYEPDYETSLPLIKILLSDPKRNKIKSEDCSIERLSKSRFLMKDNYGGQGIFSLDEMKLLADIWERVQKVEPNVIDFT